MPSTAATNSMNSSTATSRSSTVTPGVVAHPFEFVEDRVLAFLFPVEQEHAPEQLGELGIGVDALAIVELGEQLDIQRQCQHRPGAFAEDDMGDGVVIDIETIAAGQDVADHGVDKTEQRPGASTLRR